MSVQWRRVVLELQHVVEVLLEEPRLPELLAPPSRTRARAGRTLQRRTGQAAKSLTHPRVRTKLHARCDDPVGMRPNNLRVPHRRSATMYGVTSLFSHALEPQYGCGCDDTIYIRLTGYAQHPPPSAEQRLRVLG